MPSLTFKRDPYLLGFAGLVVLVVGVLVLKGAVTWKEAAVFLSASFALPGLFGTAPKDDKPKDDDDDNTPTLRPPPPPVAGAMLVLLMLALTGCASASRAQARGAVLATAEAVKVGDDLCARVAIEKSDLPLARSCAKAYDDARAASLTAANAVDAWDEGKKHDIACAVKKASDALGTSVEALRARGAAIPKIIDDARLLASALGGCS